MVRALPEDGNRYEVIDGELFVTPAPSVFHQRAVVELLYLVGPYVKAHRIGEALISMDGRRPPDARGRGHLAVHGRDRSS